MADDMDKDAATSNRDSFKTFLVRIGAHLTRKNISDIIFLADLPDGQSQHIQTPVQLFKELASHGKISPEAGGLDFLIELLKDIQRNDIARKVTNFINEQSQSHGKTAAVNTLKSSTTQSYPAKELPSPKKSLTLMKPSDYIKKPGTATSNEELIVKLPNKTASVTPHKKLAQPASSKKLSPTTNEDPVEDITEAWSVPNEELPAATSSKKTSTAVCSEEAPVSSEKQLDESGMEIVNPYDDEEEGASCSSGQSMCFTTFSQKPSDPVDVDETEGDVESDFYKMESEPRGFCIIINNEDFQGAKEKIELENREGTAVDAKNLKHVFTSFKFDVKEFKDLTAAEIDNVFKLYAHYDHSHFDCFVACILSHGTTEGFYGVDGKIVNFNHIVHHFKHSKTLKAKPKVFFCQFCRGENVDEVVRDGVVPSHSFKDNPSEADFYLAYATPSGYVSWRSKKNGTWFISKTCEWLRKKARFWHLDDIMTSVKGEIAKGFTSENNKQIPYAGGTLTKKLKFL